MVSDPALAKPSRIFQSENSYAEVQSTNLEGIEGKLNVAFFPYMDFLSI